MRDSDEANYDAALGSRIASPMIDLVKRIRRKWQWRGIVQYESDYLAWMSFANAGMLHPGHRHLMDVAVRALPSEDPVIEIGSFCGLSTNVLTYFLKKHHSRNKLIAADPWVFEGEDALTLPESTIPFNAYRELVREQFERNVRFWNGDCLPHSYALSSDEFFKAWSTEQKRDDVFGRSFQLGGPISFCFIDGDHTYDQAKRDFINADRFLAPGGLVLFDDSNELGEFPEVHRVVQEAIRDYGYELIATNPHHARKPR